jgi:hypothetical protein
MAFLEYIHLTLGSNATYLAVYFDLEAAPAFRELNFPGLEH